MRCETPFCLNESRIGRSECAKCNSRRWRKNNPEIAAFHSLRARAKVRDIPFSLTIREWRQFCLDTGYIELRGTGANDMTVDRKEEQYGYAYFNIQMISNSENVRKYRMKKGWSVRVKKEADDPF